MTTVVADRPATAESPHEFVKALTLMDATMLVAGAMIGSGIFIVSADIARSVGSPFWLLVVWVVTGVMTLLGALAYGELAAMFPSAGGQYLFLREAMGPLMGFLYGWTLFVVIQTGTIAAVLVAFARFLGELVPAISPDLYSWFPHHSFATAGGPIDVGLSPQRLVALVIVWLLTWINLRGVREGKFIQTTFTIVKTGALALLVILCLTLGRNATAISANFTNGHFFGHVDIGGALVLAFGASLVGSLFSSDAWNNVTFAAAEVHNPKKNLPLALALGTGLVTLLYVLTNVGYLFALPMYGSSTATTIMGRGIQFATQDRVGTAAAQVFFGSSGATVMAIAILVSTFGCSNGLILAGPRAYFAMARDGVFFKKVGQLNERRVPASGLVYQGLWTSLLCLTGTYGQLLNYVIFAQLVFYALTTTGLFILRRTRPDAERPYRAVGYPWLPGLYIVLAAITAIILLIADKTRAQSLAGLAIVVVGVPVFLWWRRAEAS